MTGDKSVSVASLSLDLDNQWSYMKTHGDVGWDKYPSYFDIFIPGLLDLLRQLDLKITFFVVGQDAGLRKNEDALKQIVERGHEIGNHSYFHEPWLHSYSRDRVEREVIQTGTKIAEVTGQKPIGFRGPGFTWNKDLFDILVNNGYRYDASTLPTYLGTFARLYYFWSAKLTVEERKQRKDLYGKFRDGLRPVKPYFWHLPSGKFFLEIPVTTVPFIKVPFHLSYLLYISRFSKSLMLFFLSSAIALCKITSTRPSFLLHPLDFIGGKQVPELKFFPGMDLSKEYKEMIFMNVIKALSKHFTFVNMSTFAETILENRDKLKLKQIAVF
jgi:hypothetical protein